MSYVALVNTPSGPRWQFVPEPGSFSSIHYMAPSPDIVLGQDNDDGFTMSHPAFMAGAVVMLVATLGLLAYGASKGSRQPAGAFA